MLSFETKLRLLTSSTMPEGGPHDPLVLAVLLDLLAEQAPWQTQAWGAGALAKGSKETALPRLEALTAAVAKGSLDTAKVRVANLAGWLSLVANARIRFWEWLPPFLWLRRSHALRSRVAFFVEVVRASFVEADARIDEASEALKVALANEANIGTNRAALFTESALAKAGLGVAEKTDAAVFEPDARVLPSDAFDAIRAADEKRAAGATVAVARGARARRELLLDDTCEALVQRSVQRVRIEPTTTSPEAETDFSDLRESEARFGLKGS